MYFAFDAACVLVFDCFTLQALDADTSPSISYRWQIEPNNLFSVNPSTGVISSIVGLDYETQTQYEFYVTTTQGAADATNSPNANFRALVRINIIVSDFVCLEKG